MSESFVAAGKALSVGLMCSSGGDISINVSTDSVQVAKQVGRDVCIAAVTLGALYTGYKLISKTIDAAVVIGLGGDRDDQEIRGIRPGCLHVLLHCFTDERFLEVVADYESGKMKERLEYEFNQVGIKVEGLKVEIENIEEVEKTKEAISERIKSRSEMADVRGEHKINTSEETEEERLERKGKARLEKQNLERESIREQILEVCKILCLDDSQDVADIPAIPDLCRLLKQLAVISELKLDSDIADVPEDFSCLLKLLKAHRYSYCNITTCCEILNRLLEVSGSPYSTHTQAEVLKELSELWITKPNFDKAISFAEELAKLARVLGDKKLEAQAYYLLVKPLVLEGPAKLAKLMLEKCVQCSEESGDELTIGYSKYATATIYYLEQQYEKALEEDEKFLEIARRLNNKLAQCEAILSKATIYSTLFKIQTSLNLFSEGLKIAQELGHRKKVLETQTSQTIVFSVMGDYRKAYRVGKKMVESLKNYEDKALVFTALCNLSVHALLLNEDNVSLRFAKESLVVAERLDAEVTIALAYGNIGMAQEKLQDYLGAIESYKMCLEYGKRIGNKRAINNAFCHLGRAYECNGDKETARHYYLEALDMLKPPSSHSFDTIDLRVSPDYLLGKMAVEENDFPAARKYFQQVIIRCEKFREKSQDSPLKICLNDTLVKPFQYLQYVLSKDKADGAALLVGEMGRARDFYDKVIKEDESKELNTPEALINLAKNDNQAVLFLSKLDVVHEMRIWFIAPDGKITSLGQPLEQWEKILTDLQNYFSQVLIGDVQQSSQCKVEVTDDADHVIPLSLEGATEFRGVANEESEDESDDEKDEKKGLYATPQEASTHPSSISHPVHTQSGHTASDIPKFSDVIDELSELIVRPIEENLRSMVSQSGAKPQLLIIPQADTFNIPYSTLRLENGEPLCSLVSLREAFSFHSCSYSTTRQEESRLQAIQMEDVLIVGNPTNNMPFAQREAEIIARKLGVRPLTNESATRSEVLRRLTKAPVIHFACSGTIDGKKLILAPAAQGHSNAEMPTYLTVEDISNMSLQAKLVVLSACHTARGIISCEGVLGLARAFLIAGATSVVTALWAVEDKATERFLVKFYDNLYSERVANALASTMCEMKREHFEVAQWGSLQVLGANVEVFSSTSDV